MPTVTARRRWLMRGFAVAVSLVACEVLLTLVRLVVPVVDYHLSPPWDRVAVDDPRLGVRPSPFHPRHDRRGFNNDTVPERCDVLAVGDSLTYGYSAMSGEDWPRVVARRTGKTVYSMAFGGYGPVEFLALVEEGLELRPRTVVVATYLGNDLADAYRAVYLEGRAPELSTGDADVRAAMARADEQETLQGRLYRLLEWSLPVDEARSLKQWLSEESALYGLLRAISMSLGNSYKSEFREDAPEGDQFDIAAQRDGRLVCATPEVTRTVFMPSDALGIAMDLEDPRILAGVEVYRLAFAAIDERVRAAGGELLVAMLRTKQTVFRERIAALARDPDPDQAARARATLAVIAAEDRLSIRLEQMFATLGVRSIGTDDALRAALDRGIAVFPESDDEHPNGAGYEVIGDVIARALQLGSEREPGERR